MKVLRLALIFVFVFPFLTVPVQAKAGERYGFMALLTNVNQAMPIRFQAEQAFHRLLPQLLAAQKSGTILDFEPEFAAGILKIKYAAAAPELALGTLRVFDNIHAAVASVPHKQAASAAPEVFSPSFWPSLYSSCFYVNNAGTNSHIIGSLRDKTNAVVANYVGDTDASGFLFDCFNYSGPYSNVIPGYKLTYNVYNPTGTTLLGTYSATAQNISFTSIDPVNSTASGTALANKPYKIWWYHRNLNGANTYINLALTGTVSGTATWSVDFGTTKFRGGDSLDVYITQSSRFIFDRWLYVPYSYCEIGSNYCSLQGTPLQSASLTMTHASVPYTFTGTFNIGGWFGGDIEDNTGAPIFLTPGDTVSGSGISTYTLPTLTATPHYATDLVTGKAPANKYFYVEVYDPSAGGIWWAVWAHSDALGNYSANFHSMIDLKAGELVTYDVYYVDPVTGNASDRYFPTGP